MSEATALKIGDRVRFTSEDGLEICEGVLIDPLTFTPTTLRKDSWDAMVSMVTLAAALTDPNQGPLFWMVSNELVEEDIEDGMPFYCWGSELTKLEEVTTA